MGGGNTPGGMCSAIYAACISNPQNSEKIIKKFKKTFNTNDLTCEHFINKYGKGQCNNLVKYAIELSNK